MIALLRRGPGPGLRSVYSVCTSPALLAAQVVKRDSAAGMTSVGTDELELVRTEGVTGCGVETPFRYTATATSATQASTPRNLAERIEGKVQTTRNVVQRRSRLGAGS